MNAIIMTAIATLITILAIEAALLEAYRAGRRKAEQEHADERTRMQELMDEYRMRLADVRIREKLARKRGTE